MAEQESGPYFYLSKVESREEARLWDDIFTWAEKRLELPVGTIKSCVLIENILATFQMDSILYELRRHCIGLNCGIWDYSASIISLFGKKENISSESLG
jgi:malate synthase